MRRPFLDDGGAGFEVGTPAAASTDPAGLFATSFGFGFEALSGNWGEGRGSDAATSVVPASDSVLDSFCGSACVSISSITFVIRSFSDNDLPIILPAH